MSAPADQSTGEADQAVVDAEVSFPAHGQSADLVQQGEGLLDDVAQLARAFDTAGLGLRDDRFGATFAAGPAERCAAVGLSARSVVKQRLGRPQWPAIGG